MSGEAQSILFINILKTELPCILNKLLWKSSESSLMSPDICRAPARLISAELRPELCRYLTYVVKKWLNSFTLSCSFVSVPQDKNQKRLHPIFTSIQVASREPPSRSSLLVDFTLSRAYPKTPPPFLFCKPWVATSESGIVQSSHVSERPSKIVDPSLMLVTRRSCTSSCLDMRLLMLRRADQ